MPEVREPEQSAPEQATPFQILSDIATDAEQYDYLRFARYADALAFLIDQKGTATPLIMAISAPWGAGKTTLANLVEEQLKESVAWDRQHIICRFNAWKHDDAENLGAAFAADVANRANSDRHVWHKVWSPLPSPMLKPEQRWRRRLGIIAASAIIALIIVWIGHRTDVITALMIPTKSRWPAAAAKVPGFASILILTFAFAFVFPKIFSGMRSLARFIDHPGAEAARGSIDLVRDQLGKLIHQATHGERRFIIFVDDLERCRPPRAVEVCEVASQLLNHKDVVTVLVADMQTIARSAAIKYRELEIPNSQQADIGAYAQYGRAYLEKLVQIQFDLPPPSSEQLKAMLLADRRGSDSKAGTSERPVSVPDTNPASRSRSSSPGNVTFRDAPTRLPWISYGFAGLLAAIWGFVFGFYSSGFYDSAGQSSFQSKLFSFFSGFVVATFAFFSIAFAVIVAVRTRIAEGRARKRAQENRARIDKMTAGLKWTMTIDDAVKEVAVKGLQDPIEEKAARLDFLTRIVNTWLAEGTISVEPKGKASISYVRKRIFVHWLGLLQQQIVASTIDDLVYKFLPERPRGAKRLLNQVRLMMVIALSRDLFKKKLDLSEKEQAVRLGKWLVLLERWPNVADFMRHNQDQISRLEISDDLASTEWREKIGGIDDIENLRRLLNLNLTPPPFGDIRDLLLLGGMPSSPL
jgi:hypothetical protein